MPANLCGYKNTFLANLYCFVHFLPLTVYAATFTPIPRQFMRIHAIIIFHFILLHTRSFPDNICGYINTFPRNLYGRIHFHYLSLNAATFTHSQSIYVATYNLIPCQFMLQNKLS